MSQPPSAAAAARASAARVLDRVVRDGRTLEDALAQQPVPAEDRATVQSLAWGAARWFLELDACLALLADRLPRRLDPTVRTLAVVGLYQLSHGGTPPHAAVAETVEAVRLLGKAHAAGLVNAVLRRFQRERDAVLAAAHRAPQALFAHPAWLIDAIGHDWPDDWRDLLAAGNQHPPMWLRVNVRRGPTDAYRVRLDAQGMETTASELAPEALQLAAPVPVAQLPGFAAGDVSVQDVTAQLAARLLDTQPGMRVLDACAAPGGKACHLLELQPGLAELVALDIDAARGTRIRDNLARLGLAATVLTGDAAAPATWWDGRPFERILLDVPCSGTGVIRRHPDIKLLRRRQDIGAFAARQRQMLDAAWPLLSPGGRLLYATCSVLRAENAAVVEGFLAAHPGAADVTESARLFAFHRLPAAGAGPGLALPTGTAGGDGFYYACLERPA